MKKLLPVCCLVIAGLAPVVAHVASPSATESYGEHQYEQFCSKCHSLPSEEVLRNKWSGKEQIMLNYIQAFGATPEDVEMIRRYLSKYK